MNKDIVEKLNLMAMQNFISYYGNHVFFIGQLYSFCHSIIYHDIQERISFSVILSFTAS